LIDDKGSRSPGFKDSTEMLKNYKGFKDAESLFKKGFRIAYF